MAFPVAPLEACSNSRCQQPLDAARVWERLEPDGNEPPLIVVGPTGGAHALNALVALVMHPT